MLESVKPSSQVDVNLPRAEFVHIKKELEKFGLSKAQAEIYVLLVAHKELRIQEIVSLAKMPRSSVYVNLARLYELGIAEEITENSFKKIRPYPIGVMRHGLYDQIVDLKKLSNDLDKLEKTIGLSQSAAVVSSTMVRSYKDRSGARQIFWNTFKAQDTVLAFSDWGRERYVGTKFYENFVDESYVRNVNERSLINLKPETVKSIRKYTYPGSPISRTKLENIRVIDKKLMLIHGETFIYENTYAQVYVDSIKIHGFEIESSNFASTQRSVFETMWKIAKPVSDFL